MSNVIDTFTFATNPYSALGALVYFGSAAPNYGEAIAAPEGGGGAGAGAGAGDEEPWQPPPPLPPHGLPSLTRRLIGVNDPPFSAPLPGDSPESAPSSPPPELQCPECGEHFRGFNLILHVMVSHPPFFALWSDYSNRILGEDDVTESSFSAIAGRRTRARWGDDPGDEAADGYAGGDGGYEGQNWDRYDGADEEEGRNWGRYDGNGDLVDDGWGQLGEDGEESEEEPEPTYEEYLALCERIGPHAVGVSDIDAAAPRVSSAADPAERCTICLESMANLTNLRKIKRCRHEFCDPCLRRWFLANHTCPICKDDAREGATPRGAAGAAGASAGVAAAEDAHSESGTPDSWDTLD